MDVFGVAVLGVIHRAVLRARGDRRTALYAILIRASINAALAWWISVFAGFALRAYALHRDWTVATIGPTKTREAPDPSTTDLAPDPSTTDLARAGTDGAVLAPAARPADDNV